ncbi:hypothetical protein GGR20_002514 [Devosia subaequoris]|uniref:Uncharacterized protein n=1 Tax=Devosia subaequoris TaxID=395930 RepID=A0A7W6IPI4_9HYPH|nr:hypothetical protein [Devosia subaequoris]
MACSGTNVSMPALGELVLAGVQDRLLPPDRLAQILEALVARKRRFAANVDDRLEALNAEWSKVESALRTFISWSRPANLARTTC